MVKKMRRVALVALLLGIAFGMKIPVQADEKPKLLTIAMWNLEWFYDDHTGDNFSDLSKKMSAPSAADWQWKVEHVANAVAEMRPTIIAFQEVENRKVLMDLKKELEVKHQLNYRIAFAEGFDMFTEQDVGVLYQSGLVEFSWREQTYEMFKSEEYYNVNKHLFCKFEWGKDAEKESLVLFTGHLRATAEAADIRKKQSKLVRKWCEDLTRQGENVVLLGDWNTEDPVGQTTKGGELDILMGTNNDDLSDDLMDLSVNLPKDAQVTHVAGKAFDRILASKSMLEDAPNKSDIVFRSIYNRRDLVVRGDQNEPDHRETYYGIPAAERDTSDHYPLIGIFDFK
jgi:endonuclease/exonuclease/phosphatase family metal-dependent hydrolase